MAPAVLPHPEARPKEVSSLSDRRIPPAGDPFYAAGQGTSPRSSTLSLPGPAQASLSDIL